jgi:molybdopterin-guanine dinucleotide biosynthesis protein MobB
MTADGTTTRMIGFYGFSESGKTTLIEQAISHLKQDGYAVAAIKQSDQSVQMDQEGKDTWRFSAAGAEMVALRTPAGTSLIFHKELGIRKLTGLMMMHYQPDFILVEGARDAWIPKIQIGSIKERENTVWTYNGVFEDLIQTILEKGVPCIPFK